MIEIHNPYEGAFTLKWFKGDIHIHSNTSDGKATPDEIMERLSECGFDFAALADHDVYNMTEKNTDPVIIGNSEMRSTGGDILTLFADALTAKDESPQLIIDEIRAQGGLAILAHPKIGEFTDHKQCWAYSSDELINELTGYTGMEIYTHNIGSGFQTAIDRLDAVWTYFRKQGNKEIKPWGFATSDAHSVSAITPNVGIEVAAKECTPQAIRQAIEAGQFYSLAGSAARFKEITIFQNMLRIIVDGARAVQLFGVPQKTSVGDKRQLAIEWAIENDQMELNYQLTGAEQFIRIEAMDEYGRKIYANPISVHQSNGDS